MTNEQAKAATHNVPGVRKSIGGPRLFFPAGKLLDMVIGIDLHYVPALLPHPYFGPVLLWQTPKFPSVDVFINNIPATTTGAMGYFVHIPQGTPTKPTNESYWQRYLINIALVGVLVMLTTMANAAIATISAKVFQNKYKPLDNFIMDVTGIDPRDKKGFFKKFKESLPVLSQWQTWVRLLLPPLPFPGSNGSVAVGSPSVNVNGAPLAFTIAPFTAISCSELPVALVPNAMSLGFSNVLVGVSIADLARGIAVSTAQNFVSESPGLGMMLKGKLKKGNKSQNPKQGLDKKKKGNKSQNPTQGKETISC